MAKKEEKKISIFGEAKVKSSGSKPKDDKEVVYIDGLESKLLELQFLKAQIADLEAQLVGVTDEIKTISKEKFVELYQSNRSNPNTFLIKDGEGCVMVIPTDRYISIKDEDRANQLIEEYGDDIITIDEKYYFNSQVLERNMSAIEKIIRDAKTISDDDKRNLLVKEVKYSISKGYIDNLAVYGNKIETVIDDIQPVITLKNCGGKMEEGGMMGDDFIGNVYENGGGVGTFINSSDDISWLKENHLQDLEYENFNSAIIYGNEDSPEKIELFEKLEPLYTDTPTTFILKDDYNGYEKVFEKGGFLGGIFGGGRTYKKGLAYKLDRAKHNKSEDWEVPMKNRKKRYEDGDMVDSKNQNIMKFLVNDRETQKEFENYLNELSILYFNEYGEDLEEEGYNLDNLFNISVFNNNGQFETTFSVPFDDNINFEISGSIEEKFGDIVQIVPYYYEGGGFLGGIFGGGRTYKKGLAYKLDRAKHNKSEDWEVPMKNRKKRYEDGDMVDAVGDLYFISDDGYEVYIKESDYQKEALSYFKKPLTQQEVKKLGTSKYNAFIHHLSKKGYDKKYANGGGVGNIPNNYEGKSPKDIWDSWSKEQRKHFLYDHQSDARDYNEVGGSKGYYYSDDIDKWVEMEWNELPYAMIKNLVFEHTDSGQYAKGGGLKNNDKYAKGSTVKGVVGKLVGSYETKEKAEKMKKVFENAVSTEKGESFYVKKIQNPKSKLKYDLFKTVDAKSSTVKGNVYDYANGGGVDNDHSPFRISVLDENGREQYEYFDDEVKAYERFIEHKSDFNYVALEELTAKLLPSHLSKGKPLIPYEYKTITSYDPDYDYEYGGALTDENVVMQNCSNGEIHCDMLEEIIGSKPEYPYQQVGSIRLKKCYLRPYYKIS